MIFQGRGRPQGNLSTKEISLFQKKTLFSKVEAARRATSTKREIVIF